MARKKLKPKKYFMGALAAGVLAGLAAKKLLSKKKESKVLNPNTVAQTVANAANPTGGLMGNAMSQALGSGTITAVKKGGMVQSRGNKLARSKPTKIC